jgi:hypothetical protein
MKLFFIIKIQLYIILAYTKMISHFFNPINHPFRKIPAAAESFDSGIKGLIFSQILVLPNH